MLAREIPSIDGLKTERLTFKRVSLADFDVWMEFFNSEEALRFFPYSAGDREGCKAWLTRQEDRYAATGSGLNWLINDKGEKVGQCGLLTQTVDDIQELEIGYSFIPRFWGNGYATEAAKACKNFAFERNLNDHLISIIDVENIPSQRVAERNGMKRWKTTTFHDLDVYIYRIDKEEWQAARK